MVVTMGGPILAKGSKSNTTLGGCGLGYAPSSYANLGGFLISGCLILTGGDFIGGSKPGGGASADSGHGLAGCGTGGNSGLCLIGGSPLGWGSVFGCGGGAFLPASVAFSFGFPTAAKVLCNPDPELPLPSGYTVGIGPGSVGSPGNC